MTGQISVRKGPFQVVSRRSRHRECEAFVVADASTLFAYLDDHRRMSGHMSKRSWMMAGSSMTIEVDDREGRAVGSHITLKGAVLGIPLFVDEVVSRYSPGEAKTWETVGAPRLLVIGSYRMGFFVEPQGQGSLLRVSIDYEPPKHWLGRIACTLFGPLYANWCVKTMVRDAVAAFQREGKGANP